MDGIDFGPHGLAADSKRSKITTVDGRSAKLRAQVRIHCPRKPGVYAMLDQRGEIIYVGKAKSLRARLLGYFRVRGRDRKAGRIIARARRIAWETCASEFAALHRELELIQRWQPRYNVAGLPRWRNFVWVCLGRQPAPYVYLARNIRGHVLGCFGPVPAGEKAREAVRRLNNHLGLRDCPQSQRLFFSDQAELFPMLHAAGCLRYEIGGCLGPCVGACSRPQYDAQVQAAQRFLEGAGAGDALLDSLERDMQAAASEHRYERAGALRDRLIALRWLEAKLEQMRRIRARGCFIYAVAGTPENQWYLIHAGRAVACFTTPSNKHTALAAIDRIEQLYMQGVDAASLPDYENFERVLLVDAWFRKYPDERKRIMSPAAAIEKLRQAMR